MINPIGSWPKDGILLPIGMIRTAPQSPPLLARRRRAFLRPMCSYGMAGIRRPEPYGQVVHVALDPREFHVSNMETPLERLQFEVREIEGRSENRN